MLRADRPLVSRVRADLGFCQIRMHGLKGGVGSLTGLRAFLRANVYQ
jgi:hypothetical protein